LAGSTLLVLDPQFPPLAVAFPATSPGRTSRAEWLEQYWPKSDEQFIQGMAAAAPQRGTHRLSTIPGWPAERDGLLAPVVAADERLGFVVLVWGAEPRKDGAELDRLLLEHAAVTMALLITRRHMAMEAAIRLKDDLLDG